MRASQDVEVNIKTDLWHKKYGAFFQHLTIAVLFITVILTLAGLFWKEFIL